MTEVLTAVGCVALFAAGETIIRYGPVAFDRFVRLFGYTKGRG